jgi:hypothetical protein
MYCLICLTTHPEMGQDNVVNRPTVMMLQAGRPRKYGSMTGSLQGILIMNDFSTGTSVSLVTSQTMSMESIICLEALVN